MLKNLPNLTKTLYAARITYGRSPLISNALMCRHKTTDDKKPPDPKAKPADAKAKPADAKPADAKAKPADAKAKAKAAPKKQAPPPKPDVSAVEKLHKLQALFQEDNGLPVHLKGGAKDQILYRLTWGLCIIGLLMDVKLFLDLALK